MKPVERRAMYQAIIDAKPKKLLEIGTWKGGGSTYIISCAAHEYGGTLHTIEIDPALHESAKRLYRERMNILKPHVRFHLGDAVEVIPALHDELTPLGFALLDGKEDRHQTVEEYNLIKDLFVSGSILACHDWKISKMAELRPIIEADSAWKPLRVMLDTETGFAMFIHL